MLNPFLRFSDKTGPLPKKFKCVECPYVAARPTELKTHLKAEHGRNEDTILVCEIETTGEKLYMCTKCSYSKGQGWLVKNPTPYKTPKKRF